MKGKAMTVLGPLSPERLGITLAHEHLLIDLMCIFREPSGAGEKIHVGEPLRLDNLWWVKQNMFSSKDNILLSDARESAEEVMEYKRFGGGTIVEVTNRGIGRDPISLRCISRETGINIIMGSGYYVASAHPPDMSDKTEEEIAEEIIRDIKEGVGGTGIKAGIIGEIGISDILKNPNEEKSLRAAIMAQRETGAPLTIHPPIQRQFERIIEILEEEGAEMGRVIMSHTQRHMDASMDYIFMLADTGVYIEYDTWGLEGNWPDIGVSLPSDTQRLNGIMKLIENRYLDQVLLSQDICLKMMLMAYGGTGYAHILRDILPLFRHAGVTEDEIRTMLIDNPKRILEFV